MKTFSIIIRPVILCFLVASYFTICLSIYPSILPDLALHDDRTTRGRPRPPILRKTLWSDGVEPRQTEHWMGDNLLLLHPYQTLHGEGCGHLDLDLSSTGKARCLTF